MGALAIARSTRTGVAVITRVSYSACVTVSHDFANDSFFVEGADAGASDTSSGVRSCTGAVIKDVAVLVLGKVCADERRFGIVCVEECGSPGVNRLSLSR